MKDCKCNCKGVCQTLDIRSPLNKINSFLSIKGSELLSSMYYGYHDRDCIYKEILEARLLQSALEYLQKAKVLGDGSSCMCDEDIQSLVEKANHAVEFCTHEEQGLEVDRSGRDKFLINNPQCVSYESWERFSEGACNTIGFEIKTTKDKCDIMFQVSRDIISCDLLYNIQVYNKFCDLGYKISRTEEECKIDYKLLMENHDCDMTFKTYLRLVNANISYSLVDEALSCGLTLKVMDGQPYLITPMGEYCLSDISPTNMQYLIDLGKRTTIKESDIAVDYE